MILIIIGLLLIGLAISPIFMGRTVTLEQMNEQMRLDFHARGHTGKGIIVHILDTGMDPNAFIYLDRGVARSKIIASPFGEGGKNKHGEQVAAVVLKWLPDARIINWNVLGNGKNTIESIIQALEGAQKYALAHPEFAHIVNMSLSGELDPGDAQTQRMRRAVDALAAADCPVFVAAGNDGKNNTSKYPSYFESPITVSALRNDGTKAPFSTFHDHIDFCELGVRVTTIFAKRISGTSAACPELLGKAGLFQSEYRDLTGGKLTDAALYECLKDHAFRLNVKGWELYAGYGFVALGGTYG